MKRRISNHRSNVCNEALTIETLDDIGPGGANHHYFVYGYDAHNNPSADSSCRDTTGVHILFQNGPIGESGVNGLTNEALLAIVIDRLEGFQGGMYACRANQDALDATRTALACLNSRTAERLARGVEGTHQE